MTPPNVIGGAVAVLVGDPTLAAAVPGGWHHDAAPSGTVRPFGIVELAEDAAPVGELDGAAGLWSAAIGLRVVVEGNARAGARASRDRALEVLRTAPMLAGFRVTDAWPTGAGEGLEVDDGQRVWSNAAGIVELMLEAVA